MKELSEARGVSQDEIDRFQKNGWVKLENFLSADVVSALLSQARKQMGDDGDSNAVTPGDGEYDDFGFVNLDFVGAPNVPAFRKLVRSIGNNASLLMARKNRVGARYFADAFAPKLPANKKGKHLGNKETLSHQDWPTWSLDRTGGMTFWVALSDIGPKDGTMEFFNGSHRAGPLCGYNSAGGPLLETYPEIQDRYPSSGPQYYKAGDATVHSDLCVHGAGLNLSDNPRWNYFFLCLPADACWNGAPTKAFDTKGMTQFSQLDEERFPTISGD